MALSAIKDGFLERRQLLLCRILGTCLCKFFEFTDIVLATLDRDLSRFDVSDELLGALSLSFIDSRQGKALTSDGRLMIHLVSPLVM